MRDGAGEARRSRRVLVVGTCAAIWLGLGCGSAFAAAPQFGIENHGSQLCASSGTGAPGTVVKQLSCSIADNHKGDYEESWFNAGLLPGAHLQATHYYKDQPMCMTIRNGALAVGTPVVMEPCGGEAAVGQLFDELTAVSGNAPDGTLLRAYGEDGRKSDDIGKLSPYCLASRGGAGTAVVLARCDNRLATQGWTVGAESAPSDPTPAGDPEEGP